MELGCFMVRCFAPAPALILRQSLFRSAIQTKNNNGSLKATAKTDFHEDYGRHDNFFQSAISHSSLRFRETLRSDNSNHPALSVISSDTLCSSDKYRFSKLPSFNSFKSRLYNAEHLFVDSYAGCFAPPNLELEKNSEQKLHRYCLGTRYIDDQLLSVTKGVDGAKQVVLFTDGMDTRAYRLNWPSSTVIYDVSPQAVYNKASQKLQDVGARIPGSRLLLHVPLESSDMQQLLRDKGFNVSRPSIWVFQGYPVANLASFKEILFMATSLAMKGCLFLGEFPVWLMETEMGIKWMDKLFMSYGFRVRIIGYDDVAKNIGQGKVVGDPDNLLFAAEHLRFSDDQMENWRAEFQRIEDEGDEDGFVEL